MWNKSTKNKPPPSDQKSNVKELKNSDLESSENSGRENSNKFISEKTDFEESIRSSNQKFMKSEPVRKEEARTQSKAEVHSMTNLEEPSTDKKHSVQSGLNAKNRSKSVSNETKSEAKTRNEIQKDVDRTFQGEKYFKRTEVKEMLHTILYRYTEKSSLKYVQGMNFIAGYVLHHCLDYELSFNIFMFLQGISGRVTLRKPGNAQLVHNDTFGRLLPFVGGNHFAELYRVIQNGFQRQHFANKQPVRGLGSDIGDVQDPPSALGRVPRVPGALRLDVLFQVLRLVY